MAFTQEARVSGEVVIAKVSGETVIGKISGQTVVTSVSGNIIIAKVSGEIVIGKISGEAVNVSGATVIAKVSGETVIAKVSGEIIIGKVSGEVVSVSGQPVKVSGEFVTISGQPVKVSGQTVIALNSGQIVNINQDQDMYVKYDQDPNWVERWEWTTGSGVLGAGADLDWFRKRYMGRTHAWWQSECGDAPSSYNTPYELGSGTNPLQPWPWNKGILLTNSKNGTDITDFYIGPRKVMKPPVTYIWDMYIPALTSSNIPYRNFISVGFEVNSGGYAGDLYHFSIITYSGIAPAAYFSLIGHDAENAMQTNAVQAITSGVWGCWSVYKMVLGLNRAQLWQRASGASWVNIGDLDTQIDDMAYVAPYFCTETFEDFANATLCSGIIMGQCQAFQMEHPTPVEVKTGAVRLFGTNSGGTVLHSGTVDAVVIIAAAANAGDLYIGGVRNRPYSGFGACLPKGMPVAFDIKNFHELYVCATTSGDRGSFMGVA